MTNATPNRANAELMRVTALRKARGWSIAELGRRSGLHSTTIGMIESGRLNPYRSQLEKLADALDVPLPLAAELLKEMNDVND